LGVERIEFLLEALVGRFAGVDRAADGGPGSCEISFRHRPPPPLRRIQLPPGIVDAVVVSNELPNLPHLDLDMVEHFALAKIKEALLAVTGR
jgi:hypothetical protein